VSAALLFAAALVTGCGGAGWRPAAPSARTSGVEASTEQPSASVTPMADVSATIARFRERNPKLDPYFEQAHAYVVFPRVGKGGLWLGGAGGRGYVFERGHLVGSVTLVQVTAGAQLGGQSFEQIIFLGDEAALRRLQRGKLALGADASAVVITEGAGASAAYHDGVAVFILPRAGFMGAANVAGQKMIYKPIG
jgi:lipid-binding SYLF domain-containing protein